MSRWEPQARERLEAAAMDLFSTQGYEDTTVASIAARAGVTSRTYFRHFPDKREVLFGRAERLRGRISESLARADAGRNSFAVALEAMCACADLFVAIEHGFLERREALVESSSELREREALKLASIADDLVAGLVERGEDQDEARLVADLAVVIFRRASRTWMLDPAASWPDVVHHAAEETRRLL